MEPFSNRPTITQRDINNGYVMRYFVRNISTKVVTEVDVVQYTRFKRDVMFQTLEIQWLIAGYANDIISNDGKTIFGVRHKNTITTKIYDDVMSGLLRLLRNPLEYFQGVDNQI
jgi:hypothetical protein